MESIQQQQDGTDANNATQDEGIPSFPKVDPLNQAVHCWKPIFKECESRSYQQTLDFLTNKPQSLYVETSTLQYTEMQNYFQARKGRRSNKSSLIIKEMGEQNSLELTCTQNSSPKLPAFDVI